MIMENRRTFLKTAGVTTTLGITGFGVRDDPDGAVEMNLAPAHGEHIAFSGAGEEQCQEEVPHDLGRFFL